jgi:hypothetical protein
MGFGNASDSTNRTDAGPEGSVPTQELIVGLIASPVAALPPLGFGGSAGYARAARCASSAGRSQNFERVRPGRRRERPVEGMQVVAGQLDVAGGGVLPNVERCSGAWNSVDPVVLKHPG